MVAKPIYLKKQKSVQNGGGVSEELPPDTPISPAIVKTGELGQQKWQAILLEHCVCT